MRYINTGDGDSYGTDANWDIKNKDGHFYSFTPNSTFNIYHEEYENIVHINNLGGRSTMPGEMADTTNVIPFTGDSFVMGVGVEDSENLVSITRKTTSNNFLNLGVGGTALPFQRKMIASRYEELGRPSIVIYGFFLGNDFDDIIKEYSKNPDSLLVPDNNPEKNSSSPQNGFMWKLNYYINHNSFLKKLYTLQFIKQKILNIKNKDKEKARQFMDPIFLILNSGDTVYINKAKTLAEKEIALLSKEPYKSIVILIPDRYQVNSSIRKNMCAYYNLDEKTLVPELPNQILVKLLNKYNVKYIDATQCLIKHQQDGPLYYVKDNHFTKLGQKVFSECISDSLKRILKEQQ